MAQQPYSPLEGLITAEAIQADFELLEHTLRENHPGLLVYHTSDEIDSIFAQASAVGEVTPLEAYGALAGAIDEIRDGHTNALMGDVLTDYILHTRKFFPFTLRILNEGVFVNHNFSEHDYLSRGTQILTVNHVPIEEILENLTQYVTCDGYSRLSKMEQLEGQFWWYYGLKYGYRETFVISYKEVGSTETKQLITSGLGHSDRFDILSEVYGFEWEPEEKVSFTVQGDIATITINQFHGISKVVYKSFLEHCFSNIEKHGIEHVVIDIRKNGGGREGYENLLLSFLDHQMTEKYKSVTALNMKSSAYEYMHRGGMRRMEDWVYRTFEFEDTEDGWVRRSDRFKNTLDPQKTTYRGHVYVLISGQVFSSGADFASMAKAYVPKCTLVGTETLGGQNVNTSGYYYRLELPNTGFVVEIPRILFELNVPEDLAGRGVVPDVEVHPTLEDFLEGQDPHMQKVYEIVSERSVILTQKGD